VARSSKKSPAPKGGKGNKKPAPVLSKEDASRDEAVRALARL